MAGKYWWEEDDQKEQQSSGQTTTQDTRSQGYWWENDSMSSMVGTNITDRVNTWLQNHNNYISNYQKRYSGRKYSYEDAYVSDSASWLDSVNKQKSDLATEADSILSFIDQNKSYLDEDWVTEIKNTLNNAKHSQYRIAQTASKDNEWWNSFGNEELVSKYGSAEEAYKYYQRSDGYSKKYTGKTAEELYGLVGNMDDGEEKNWLKSYASSVDYDEKSKADLNKVTNELDDLGNLYDQAYTIGLWYDEYKRGYAPYDADKLEAYNRFMNEYGGDINALEKAYGLKERYLNEAKQVQAQVKEREEYEQLKSSPNYMSKATSGLKSYEAQKIAEQQKEGGKSFWEKVAESYAYAPADTSLPTAAISNAAAAYRNDNSYREPNDKWSTEQKNHFGYLYSEDPSKAYTYAEQVNNQINAMAYRDQQQAVGDWASQNFGTGTLGTLGAIATAPLGMADFLDNIVEYGARGTITQKGTLSPFDLGQAAQSGIANEWNGVDEYGVAQNVLPDWVPIVGGKGWGDVYNLGVSAANSLVSAYTLGGTGTLVNFIGQGGASGVDDALSRGATPEQALLYGSIVGAAEGLTEFLPAEKLLKVGSSATLKNWLMMGLKQGIGEFREEGVSAIIGNVADNIIMADKSNFNEIVRQLMAEDPNLTEKEAKKKAWGKLAGEVIYDAMGGFATGSINAMSVSGVKTLWDSRAGSEDNIKAATQYGDTEVQKALIEEGLASDVNSESHQLAKHYEKKVSKGKSMTGYEIRQLVAANEAQFVVENYEEALPLAEKRLTELGETKNVRKIAELVAKRASGQELTPSEKSTLVRSQYGAKVAKEMTPETADLNYKSLESRFGNKGRFGVSESGKTVVRDTDEEIDIKKLDVATVGNGQLTFKVATDREVSAEGIDFADDRQSFLVSGVSNIENITPTAATAMIHDIVDMEKPIGPQLNGIDESFTYGYHGYSEADLKAGNFSTGLTSEQMMSAYKLGQSARASSKANKVQAIKRMRTAVQAATEQAIAEGKSAPKANGMGITYNYGNGKVVSIEDAEIKTAKQEGGIAVAKILQQMGLGTNVEFFSSKIVKDANGNKIRVFVDDNGVEQKAYSGLYRKSDGTIRIDLNAYNGRGLTLNALSHELTHFVQQWSPEKYEALAEFLVKSYEKTDMTMHDRVLREQDRLKRVRGEDVSYSEAYDEVVANAMAKMFDDGHLLEKLKELAAQDKTLVEKILEGIKEFLNKFLPVYEKQSALYHDTADIMAMKDAVEKLQSIFAEALVDASGNYRAYLTATENQLITEAGIGFDEDTRSVYSLHFSTAYQDTIQVGKKTFDTEAIAQVVAKGTSRSIEDARKWVQSEMTIANMVMANPEFLDFEADNRYEAIKKNSDYPQGTVDLSNLCPKREEFTAMFDMLQKKYPNKLFTAQDVADMRKILAENDITVACGACFVEDRRQLLGEIADTYINMWKEAVESGKPLQKTNAAGVKSDLLVTKALAKQYGLTAGSKIMATDTYIPNQYDLTTYEGFKLLEKNHPTIAMGFNRYNNSRGQQSARLIEGRAEYNRQILGWSDAKVRSVNNNGGLRIFSFSDFEVVHLLDLVQVIIDCSARGVKIQGYTKIPAFAKLVRGTGIKLNRSFIPKGDYGFHMENGKVVLDYDTVEGIDINDDNFIDDRSDPDIGNIVIGINPTQIGAAMLDPFIDYIIPFHSNKAKEILKKLGTGEWVNYKESQHEKDISTGKASKHNVNIYTEVINKYHPTNKVEFVNAFLKECKRQGKIPRYSEFLNVDANGDYAYREGYHKLLVDFKMFDAAGNILPQGNITPSLNENFMKELLNAEIKKKQNYKFPQKVYDAIDKKFGEQYSSEETDLDSEGNQLSTEQQEFFKDSKVRDADGKLRAVYHGTYEDFTVFDISKTANANAFGQGHYFSSHKSDAQQNYASGKGADVQTKIESLAWVYFGEMGYSESDYEDNDHIEEWNEAYDKAESFYESGKVMQVYLNMTNPLYADRYGGLYNTSGEEVTARSAELLKELGYDGIIDYSVSEKFGRFQELDDDTAHYIVFDSNQIKLTSNKKPTSDPDIRYSSQETDLDTETDSAYDGGKEDPVYVLHQPGQDVVEVDHELWAKKRAEAKQAYGLEDVESESVDNYVAGRAYEWNAILRGVPGYERTEFIDFWIEQAINGLSKFPRFAGRTYRNLSFANKDSLDLFLSKHQAGMDVDVEYFASSSKDPNGYVVPGDYIAHMVIDGFDGRDISDSYAIPGQQEVIYLPGTKIRITAVKTANDGHPLIYAQEVNENGENLEANYGRNGQSAAGTNNERQEGNAGGKRNDLRGVRYNRGVEGNSDSGNAKIQRSGDYSKEVKSSHETDLPSMDSYEGKTPTRRELWDDIANISLRISSVERDFKEAERDGYVDQINRIRGRLAYAKASYIEYGEYLLENYKKYSLADIRSLSKVLKLTETFSKEAEAYTIEQFKEDLSARVKEYRKDTEKAFREEVKTMSREDKKLLMTLKLMTAQAGYDISDLVVGDETTESTHEDDWLLDSDTPFSEHDTDFSNRSLLANAFEGITQNSDEYKMIQEYKNRIKLLNEQEEKLDKINAEIREIRFGTEGKYDAKKLNELEAEAKNIAKAINRHDRKLLALEASEPLRKVIEQERKKEAQKTRDHVKEIQQNKKLRAEQTELRHKIRKAIRDLEKILNRGNKKQNVKEDMKSFASKALELADYLFTDHISNDELIRKGITVRMTDKEAALVKETEDILSKLYDNADSLTDEEFTRLDAKRKANEDKLRDLLTAQRNERLNTPVYNLFNDLVTEYASLKNSKQDAVRAAYNVDLERLLRQFMGDTTDGADTDRKAFLQNMRVADMTTAELQKLYEAYKMVLTNVRDANKVFAKGKIESIDKAVEKITLDFTKRKIPDKKLAIVARNIANKIGWDYEKLYYALDRIGSETFTELVMNIANSENTVMQDVMEAAAFRDEMVKNYGFNNWDVNKEIDREFLDNTGKKFKLTLGQLMALYAYSRREGAWDHIEYGGFVFGKAALTNPKPADSYKLTKAQCEALTNLLTKDQKDYVEDMQKFLSETMGEKGNEVSMLLYGIKMFGEKNYFPIKIAGQFKAQANESQAKAAAGFSTMTNAGFTHAQNPNAKAPFVLEGFNDIWADHVNEMSRYHGTVPALEDMRRVMNRSSYSESGMESMAIKQLMENSYGKEAVEYFDNLYREANSGAITDKLQSVPKKLLSMFRKNSVAYSLSVLIQQPTSIIRAYAMIDKKYFGIKGFGTITSGVAKAVSDKWTKAHTNAYNEMLKYAPGVTMAKEIGGFDTHTGGSIRSYLLDTNKNLKQKWKTGTAVEKGKAVLDLVDDNAIANLPNLADKIAWIEIWNACKRETIAKHKDLVPTSDEFMQIVGDRFTEVIRATQVYDSMFAKSPMLKSKNLAVQYLVSFMNEPNTVANMAESAIRDATKGNWKDGAKKAVVLVYGTIMVGMAKSLIYAMRDDDEDETFIEKYIESLTGSLLSDFNPISYIPVARDVLSAAQGYDIERPDMAIVVDAISAVNAVIKNNSKDTENMTEEQLIELDKAVTGANWKLAESLVAFFGIPVKNIRRDIKGVLDHARIASANAGQTTAQSAWDKVYDAVVDSIPFMQNKNTKQDKLYDAIINGDKAYLERLKNTYKDDSAYQSAVRKALRENDPRIHDAAQARYKGRTEEYKSIFRQIQKEGMFTFDDIMSAINTEESKIRTGIEPEKATSSYTASDFVESIVLGDTKSAQAIKDDIIATKVANGKTQDEAEKEFTSNVSTGIRDAYTSGLLDEAGAEKMLMEYADKDEDEAVSKVNYWAFCEEHSEYDLSESNVNDYQEFAEPAEIPLDVFVQYVKGTKGLESRKDEWGDVEVTKREQVLEVIDSLPLTWQQKDALYLAAGYSESKIWDVPW